MSRLSKSISFLVLSLSFASLAHAQGLPGISEPVTVRVSPEFPAPNATVSISAQSFSTDLSRADFSWYVNGKLFKRGTGATEISVPSGKAGALTSVSVAVVTPDIGTFTESASFRPADVSLLWQSDGYVPPFYRGKALESYGATFKVTAIPEFVNSAGKRVDPKTLIYTWKKNGTAVAAQSGYGRDTFKGTQSSFTRGGDVVSVEVTTASRDIGATEAVTLSPTVPEVLFYESSPLYGVIFERALSDTLYLSAEEITLRAEPFNISAAIPLSGLLSFDWTMNAAVVPDFRNKNEITLRQTGAPGGQSAIGVSIQHEKKVLQGGQAKITIIQ